jgi:hypothetical protein
MPLSNFPLDLQGVVGSAGIASPSEPELYRFINNTNRSSSGSA